MNDGVSKKTENENENDSLELSALMMAHLDEVEGGGAHGSWRRVTAALVGD